MALHAEARRQHAVVGGRRAAALDVAEDRHTRLEAGALLDLALELDRDAAEARVAERVGLAAGRRDAAAVARHRALGDDDDRERRPARVAALDALADLVDVERALGDEDDVGAAGDAAVGRDPARVAAHDLDDDDAVVRLRGRVQAVDRVGGDLHRGVEAEGDVGAGEVVVDRLGDADHRHAVGRQPARDAERVLAADRDQRVDAFALERLAHERGAVGAVLVGVRARRAEDRAAAVQDARRVLGVSSTVLASSTPAQP